MAKSWTCATTQTNCPILEWRTTTYRIWSWTLSKRPMATSINRKWSVTSLTCSTRIRRWSTGLCLLVTPLAFSFHSLSRCTYSLSQSCSSATACACSLRYFSCGSRFSSWRFKAASTSPVSWTGSIFWASSRTPSISHCVLATLRSKCQTTNRTSLRMH